LSDPRTIHLVLGLLLLGLAALMLATALADLALGAGDWQAFVGSAALTGFVGGGLALSGRGGRFVLGLRDAFLLTTICWLAVGFFGALPFYFRPDFTYADAVFEAISGLTTTGSTVLVGLDRMPAGVLLWRSLLQWIGGVGIVVVAVLILPLLRVGGMQLFAAESSSKSEKVLARPVQFAIHLIRVYLLLTLACAIAYRLAGMSTFDAVNHAMTTLATGGYSTHDASLAHFPQPALHWIATVFMTAGALPFVLYIKAMRGDWHSLWRDQQVRGFLLLLLAVSVTVALWLKLTQGMPILQALRLAAFNVTSIVTTTGYATADYMTWGAFPIAVFLLMTFAGGCTGSTSGAIKMFRHQILLLMAREQLQRLVMPHATFRRRYNGQHVPEDIIPSVLGFLAVYLLVTCVLTLGLTVFGLDLVTAVSGAATAIGNVGPGLGAVIGPAGSFASLPDGAKWLLSLGMLLGRLELFTVLVLFTPFFWRA
jgi:trk system potassium uptake protein TrkH